MTDMDSYKDVFLAESGDYIQQITDGLLALERNPVDLAPVEVVFRGAHSLKGMSAAMGYERTADLTHKMEGLMDKVRREDMPVTRALVDLMLAAVDVARDLIDDESNGLDAVDAGEMVRSLVTAAEQGLSGSPDHVPEVGEAEALEPGTSVDEAELMPGETLWRVTVTLDAESVLKAVRAYMVIKRLSHMGRVVDTEPSARDIEDERFDLSFVVYLATQATSESVRDAVLFVSEVAEVSVESVQARETSSSASEKPAEEQPTTKQRALPKLSETQTVRVAIGHLDTLVDLVGELVILRSRLESLALKAEDMEFSEAIDDLQRISADLQYEVMQTRMVPVGNIFNRFPRMVRDLAKDLGKSVDFTIHGLDIELDRTVLDEIGDPIVHLLRNSIDHGIESADRRAAAGKPSRGKVALTASRERDHVAIVVSDDGAGIDPERLWSKAIDRGLVAPSQRAEFSHSEILQMICLPGFSTAEKATKVSGRGVGMDVVKGKIEHLGGSLHIVSTVGGGTDFVLRLPLTVAIVKALLVECKDQLFALPLSAVDEVLGADDLTVDSIDGAAVVLLRDSRVVPLVRLQSLLHDDGFETPLGPDSRVVLITASDETFALAVGEVAGRREIVVKPLSRVFRDMRGFSGATILGDGRVVLILDPRTVLSMTEGRR